MRLRGEFPAFVRMDGYAARSAKTRDLIR
jgi:hypothetical protein